MNKILLIAKYPLAVLVAAWVTAALAAPITSVSNLLWLSSMSMPISTGVVIEVLVQDMFRMGFTLFVLLLVGYALAFSAVPLVRKWVTIPDEYFYALAAAVAMFAVLILLVEMTLKIQLIAGNRTFLGTLAHIVVACIGGLLFAKLIGVDRTGTFVIRVLGGVPLLMLVWSVFSWLTDPFSASAGMGLDLTAVENPAGQNMVIRDLTAIFATSATLLLLGLYELRHRWFWAAGSIFFFAALFNFFTAQFRGLAAPEALVAEIVLIVWIYALGLVTWMRDSSPGAGKTAG